MSVANVIIELGQSNSCGQEANANIDVSYKQTFSNIQCWQGSSFVPLDYTNGLYRYPISATQSGSVFALGVGLQAYKGGTIYYIQYAVGGTYLGTSVSASVNWNTATRGSYYDAANSTINNALAYMWNTLGLRSFNFYIVWRQGESDARSSADSSNYQTNYASLANGIRNNLAGSALTSGSKIWINPYVNTSALPTSGTGSIISAASNASPIVITTSAAHGLSTGMSANITGVAGNTAANGTWATITVVNSTQFRLDGSTGNGNYTSGGTLNTWFYLSTVNTAQQNTIAGLSNAYGYSCNSYALQSDNLHYNAQGYKDAGDYAINNIIIANNL